jgi:hypothetical protein
MSWEWLRESDNGVSIAVQAVPRSSQTKFFDLSGDRCKIKVKAPPVEGEANQALVEYLAKVLGVPKRQVRIVQGDKGKKKVIHVGGISLSQAILAIQKVVFPDSGEKS